jgi:hypothetical protein
MNRIQQKTFLEKLLPLNAPAYISIWCKPPVKCYIDGPPEQVGNMGWFIKWRRSEEQTDFSKPEAMAGISLLEYIFLDEAMIAERQAQ